MTVKYKITVKGLVQGVGYRYFCLRKANEYKINGYAKNNVNGNVDLIAEGEKNLILEFIKDLKTGPFNSSVKEVYVEGLVYDNEFSEFSIM